MKSSIVKIDVSILETFDNNEDLLLIKGGGLTDIIKDLKDLLGLNAGYCANNCDCTNPKCK